MQTDVYLVNIMPECAVAPILPYPSKRADLKDSIPAVYCGKSAAEWYSRYCQMVLRTDHVRGIRAELVEWLRKNAMFTCEHCERAENDRTCCYSADLRLYGGKRVCLYCYDVVVWADDEPAPPTWDSLTEFDPFQGLL